MQPLTTKTISQLRSKAHHLKPIVSVGVLGVSASVISELAKALNTHELVKVRLPSGAKSNKKQIVSLLCSSTKSTYTQIIGRIAIIYRQIEPKP